MRPLLLCFLVAGCLPVPRAAFADELLAGAARVEITEREAGPVNDPLYAKALVLRQGPTTVVLLTLDVVAIGEIGRIGNDFLPSLRSQLEKDLGVPPANVVVNASHCHGVPCKDVEALAVRAVKEAWQAMVPVKAGAGEGREDRISENRRLLMKDGTEIDMRRAYSMPPDQEVASVGPIDPEIGLLRLDRMDGTPLAVVYHFACHPIMNPPSKGNSADYPGYASKVIEEALGNGAVAIFLQGCGGDINPVRYKETSRPADAGPLGNLLGLSAMRGLREIATTADGPLRISNEVIAIPRSTDLERRIAAIGADQARLLAALKPTNINFKTFLPLMLQQRLSPDFPSHFSQSYLHDQMLGREALAQLDADNRTSVENYEKNILIMEQLTRLNTNLALLKRHLVQNNEAGKPTIEVEVSGLRVGDFRLVTFPGELTVQVGLNIRKALAQPHVHVSGYTNGYIYYTPTAAQRNNKGYAQEDCDSLVAPEWQQVFETKALEVLQKLGR